jgi:hypothetical protein
MTASFFDALKLVLDVTGIFACGLGVLLLIRRTGTPHPRTAANLQPAPNAGMDEGFLRLVKQTEMAFGTISNALRQEHRMLQTLMRHPAIGRGGGTAPLKARPSGPAATGLPRAARQRDTYDEALRLAERGLNVQEIEQNLKIPRGEIELALKFKGHPVAAGSPARPKLQPLV